MGQKAEWTRRRKNNNGECCFNNIIGLSYSSMQFVDGIVKILRAEEYRISRFYFLK
ncbi:MAG: hypothetical protein ACJ72Q_14495 [Nitrososphaeraceae archaeon]